jgi:hypothetical protein
MDSDRYKWIALSNTTLGVLLATLDASIILIAMPNIFRGIKLDPLVPANSFYLLWMILGYLVVTSVLIVSLGRLGDMYGRVRIYNLGFVIYTVASLLLAIDWMTGASGATYLIGFRIVQGIGGACLLANAARDHHRRLPRQPARDGARHQQHRRRQRDVRRPRARRPARADRLAHGVPDLGSRRPVRHGLGVPAAGGAQHAAPVADRLAGERDLRAGPGPRDGGGHLRDQARGRPPRPGGGSAKVIALLAASALSLSSFAAIERRAAVPDVPPAAVPHPRVSPSARSRRSCPAVARGG